MRLTHLAATLLLAAMFGCTAQSLELTNPNAKPVFCGADPCPSATPSATPAASASPVGSPSPAASATPVAVGSPSAECLAAFDRYNADKDTFLSFDEFVAGKWGDMRFVKAPTAEEEAAAKAGYRADATKADADGDGKLSRTEYATTCP